MAMLLAVKSNIFLHLACWLAFFNGGCQCLKDLRVSVPSAIRQGETAVFMCDFNLEDDQLYTVKWYKGRREFYRYTPKDEFPIKTFNIDHVHVDKNKSNMTQLTLVRVSLPLSGIYNCEVSAESPSFHTAIASGEMTVVELPIVGPSIEGVDERYKVADKLFATCASGPSKPAANLTWYINDEKVPKEYVHNLPVQIDFMNPNLLVSRSQINITVKSHTFRSGYFTLRCTAKMFHISTLDTVVRVDDAASMRDAKENIIEIFIENNNKATSKHSGLVRWGQTWKWLYIAGIVLFIGAR